MTPSPGRTSAVRTPHRVARYPALLLLVTLALAAGPRCAGSGGDGGAVLVSTADLWAAPARYDGRRVRTTGVVLGFFVGEPAEHYVIEGSAQRRVELRGVEHERLEAMRGRRAEVLGRFRFTETTGFGIEVETIRVVG